MKKGLAIQQLINDFIKETKGELWDSEKDLINHYKKDENYKISLFRSLVNNLLTALTARR